METRNAHTRSEVWVGACCLPQQQLEEPLSCWRSLHSSGVGQQAQQPVETNSFARCNAEMQLDAMLQSAVCNIQDPEPTLGTLLHEHGAHLCASAG
jgi:hypothetical protein